MNKSPLSKYSWIVTACIFTLQGLVSELPAQDWSIKQFKNQQHLILESTGQQFDFRDDVFSHLVAELKSDFIDNQLHLNILARSPRIGGYRSYRHVHGSNRLTALVLRQIVDGVASLKLREQTGRSIPATFKPTEQKLLERRLNPDGSMNYLAMTQQDFIVQLEVVSEPLQQGDYQIDLFLESELRLQIKFQVNEKFQAVSFLSSLYFESQPQSQTQQAAPAKSKLDAPGDWKERDFEGKYFLLSRAIEHDETELPRWVDFLFEQKEYRLLEEIVLTHIEGFDCNNIGERLAKVSAPNWPRLAYWAVTSKLEHTNFSAGVAIDQYRDVYYSWCRKNQIEIPADIEFKQQNVNQYWAKLDSKKLFAALKPPAEVIEFTGKKAVKGKFYLQQFKRTVLTTVNWQMPQQRSDELLQLLNHPNDELRKIVILAYTHLRPYRVPFSKLLALANDDTQADSIRELATLAAAYGPAEKVCDDINTIANQIDHPGWKPAVSRLGDIGSGYDLKVLRAHQPEDETRQNILQRSIKLIGDREAALRKIWQADEQESSQTNAQRLDASRKMDRLVEAHLQKRASAERLQQWTNQYFHGLGKTGLVINTLNQLKKRYQEDGYKNQLEECIHRVILRK